jgi:hypothetical protein
MKHFLSALFFFFSVSCFAQTNTSRLIIKSNDGEPFFLYVNGKLQSKEARSHYVATGVTDYPNVRVIFRNKKLGSLQQKLRIDEENEIFILTRAKVGYRLLEDEWNEEEDLDFSMVARSDGFELKVQSTGSGSNERSISSRDYEETTSLHHETSTNRTSGSNYYAKPDGYYCTNPILQDREFRDFKSAVRESGYKEISRSNYIYRNINKYCWRANQIADLVKLLFNDDEQLSLAKHAYTLTFDTQEYEEVVKALSSARKRIELREWLQNMDEPQTRPTPNYPRPEPTPDQRNCRGNYLTDRDFEEALKSLQNIHLEDTKMSQVDMITQNTCLSIGQVRKLVRSFHLEHHKLAVAKKLFALTFQKHLYYQVNDDLLLEHNKKELAEFVKMQLK